MRSFGLYPDDVLLRARDGAIKLPALGFSMVYGGLGFAAVSVLAYSIWAYRLIPGTGPMYASIAAIYIGLTGIVLSRLVGGPGATRRFALLFAAAFLLYAIAWCIFWFGLKGKYHADLWGAAVGLAAMTWLVLRAFGQTTDWLAAFGVLFACHSLGYYLGDDLYALVRGASGRLLWGAAHGAGFGAGLGYVLWRGQLPLRAKLPA